MLKMVFLLIAYAGINFVNSVAISNLWLWFIVPTFELPLISIPVAWGISLLATLFKDVDVVALADSKVKTNELLLAYTVACFWKPFLALSFGYILSLFV